MAITASENIQLLYNDLLKVARNVLGRNKHDAHEMLHIVLEQILKRDPSKVPANTDEFKWYAIACIKLEATGSQSVYNLQKAKWEGMKTDLNLDRMVDSPAWLGSRIDNERMDAAINMIPSWFDRTVFLVYILSDSSYARMSKEMGISKTVLYDSVDRSKKFLRKIFV